jgi:mono/diheme cytochrome c family protein
MQLEFRHPSLSIFTFRDSRRERTRPARAQWMANKKQPCRTSRLACVAELIALLVSMNASLLLGQAGSGSSLHLETGEQIYKSACVACHGPDGKGTPKSISGFEPPRTFPDFPECDQTTPEDNTAWKAIVTHGGPTRGFSQIMPSFGQALTSGQIRPGDRIPARLLPRSQMAAR